MHVSLDEDVKKEKEIEQEFKQNFPDVRFSVVHSSYRSIENPIIRYVDLVSKTQRTQLYDDSYHSTVRATSSLAKYFTQPNKSASKIPFIMA